MMKTRIALAAGAALTAALALAGCSSTSGSSSGGMSGMDTPSSSAASSTAAAKQQHNAADVMFAQMMIPHHMQAVEMADMVLKKRTGVDPKVTALATKIKQAQSPEIDQMNGFLTAYGLPKVAASGMSGMSGMSHGDGMMSAADLKALEKANGATASKLFLTQMTQHHSSAVTMARAEAKDGKDPAAVALARKIADDQTAEIAVMETLAAQLS